MNNKSIGLILLVIFLLCYGLLAISNFHFDQEHFVMGALAIGAAIFLAVGK